MLSVADRIIQTADLTTIENNLTSMRRAIEQVDDSVANVNRQMNGVEVRLDALASDFRDYVNNEMRRWELEHATTKLNNIRQQLAAKFGHYSEVRRTTTGILQATDLGIVRNATITKASEDLMLKCPEYWLAPCLVALAAWINDEKDIAKKALKEAIHRNDEKASLLFGLICRRANRQGPALEWVRRYLANQDPEGLGREAIIILDAYATGLFSADSEGAIAGQLNDWCDLLASRPGFLEEQTSRWKAALKDKRKPVDPTKYPYLRKYSHTWPILEDILEGAMAHQYILAYFKDIFAQQPSQDVVRKQLDDILATLVSEFDDEELPLKREERLCELIIEHEGDTQEAQILADREKTSMEEQRDFTQLLTDAAMYPDISRSSVSSQQFAVAYSREWICNGYNDMVAENRMKIPNDIEINIDSFNAVTSAGADEENLVKAFDELVESERSAELDKTVLTPFEQNCHYAGIACIAFGLIALAAKLTFFGVLLGIAGIALVYKHYSQEKNINSHRDVINSNYDTKKENGTKLLKATIAEIVDFRIEFSQYDAGSQEVLDMLNELSPDEYVRTLTGVTRHIVSATH